MQTLRYFLIGLGVIVILFLEIVFFPIVVIADLGRSAVEEKKEKK